MVSPGTLVHNLLVQDATLLLEDARAQAREELPHDAGRIDALGWRSVAAVPLRARGGVIGAVVTAFAGSGRRHGTDDLHTLEELADRVAQAVENVRLYEAQQRAREAAERSAAQVRAAEARFRAAFEHAPIGIALVAVEGGEPGRFLEVNGAMSEMTGYRRDELCRGGLGMLADAHGNEEERAALAR